MKNLLKNWKTTSAGATMIIGAIVHLCFVIHAGKLDEATVMTAATLILGGFGLMFAGDASTTTQAHAETLTEIENIKSAVRTGDTAIITKPTDPIANPPKTP